MNRTILGCTGFALICVVGWSALGVAGSHGLHLPVVIWAILALNPYTVGLAVLSPAIFLFSVVYRLSPQVRRRRTATQ